MTGRWTVMGQTTGVGDTVVVAVALNFAGQGDRDDRTYWPFRASGYCKADLQ